MRLLNTKEFTFHHLCDWRWLNDNNGNVLTQIAGTPKWTATLVKYAELICDHPGGQALLTGVVEDDGII